MAVKNNSYWTVEREEVMHRRGSIRMTNNGATIVVGSETSVDYVNTYAWDTDGDRAMPTQINPESLSDPWVLENRGLRDNARMPRGEYVEIYRRPAS